MIFLQTIVNKIRNNDADSVPKHLTFFSAITLSSTLTKSNQILHTVTNIILIIKKLPRSSLCSRGFECAHKCAEKQKFLAFPQNIGFFSHALIWKSPSLHTQPQSLQLNSLFLYKTEIKFWKDTLNLTHM